MTKKELVEIMRKEGDVFLWKDKDFICIAYRNGVIGHWCGYVGITKEHPAFGKKYWITSESENGLTKVEEAINDVRVHGGLTFASTHYIWEIDERWFFGFDCAHCDDIVIYPNTPDDEIVGLYDREYRTLDYVKKEIKLLAEQLRTISEIGKTIKGEKQ